MDGGFPCPAHALLGMVHAHFVCSHWKEDRQGNSQSHKNTWCRDFYSRAVTTSIVACLLPLIATLVRTSAMHYCMVLWTEHFKLVADCAFACSM